MCVCLGLQQQGASRQTSCLSIPTAGGHLGLWERRGENDVSEPKAFLQEVTQLAQAAHHITALQDRQQRRSGIFFLGKMRWVAQWHPSSELSSA